MAWLDWLGRPSKKRFVKRLMAVLREAKPDLKATYDEKKFRILLQEGGDHSINLQNVYREYCDSPREDRDAHLHRIARAALSFAKDVPEDFEDARYDLLPCLRSAFTLEHIRLQRLCDGAAPGPDIPHQTVADELAFYLVYDFPESMRSVSGEDLERWGVSLYEAMEVAMENLRERDMSVAAIGESVYVSIGGDPYDPSRLMDSEFLEQFELEGDPVAIVSSADTFILGGSEDEGGLEAMAALVEQFSDAPRPVSTLPIIFRDGQWTPWLPPEGHPHREAFRLLEIRSLHPDYAAQKELLDKLHEKQGEDVFVASYVTMEEKETKRWLNYSVWSEGVDTLLPRSQKVVFMRLDPEDPSGQKGEMVAVGSWDDVVETLGHLLEPTDMTPPRYRVKQFPTQEELARIGKGEL